MVAFKPLGAPDEGELPKGGDEWQLHQQAGAIDAKDADTPDNWVPRHPELLRLTGRHPLNCEPPMHRLMEAGFITPTSLHLVRNHGAVPKLDWKTHRVEVNGLVDRPVALSMDELVAFPSVTIPVTVTCAGNRRKEENMIKKSIGFSWGPTSTSCTYWTGVRLCDVLKHAGVRSPDQGAHFVCYRGPKGELPKGEDGSYGTSVSLAAAMDPSNDILLAYKQNGRWLTPDHGYPVRILVPGYIGGRMVKWLSEITVTKEESNNFYHYHDNRVLPPHVDETIAKEEGWWFKPDYIINELNINSAVARPWHDEVVSLKQNVPYNMKGYAYTGGGRKVIRVEVSLDDGKSWRQARIHRFEKPTVYGKHWCWVLWDLDVQVFDFMNCKEVLLRAWDSSQNGQPAHITWNVMGMMNNCYFRIQIHQHLSQDGEIAVRFQHPAPTEVGSIGIGWREEENNRNQAVTAASKPSTAPAASPTLVTKVATDRVPKTYTMEEVSKHNTEESAWFVHEGKVYDATPFLDEHPGGAESIIIESGRDATNEFNSIHSLKAKEMLADYYIGDLAAQSGPLAPSAAKGEVVPAKCVEEAATPVALNPRQRIPFALKEKIQLSHDTRLFRFALQSDQHKLGLPIGKHMFFYAKVNGEPVMRAYTPTSSDDDVGHFDLVVKVYFANVHPRFPEGGKLSQHFEQMKIGDTIDVKGPVGHFTYEGRGAFAKNRKPGCAKKISMIAGGTGITPMYQVIKAILKDPEDTTEIKLLYANQTESDILLREDLEMWAANHKNFELWYTVDRPAEGWKYSSGFVDQKMIEDHLFEAGDGNIVLMCGPPPMINFACIPNLKKIGYEQDSLITF
ncbi:unnamed protein product [Ostreobium quekettii]|uniref:Nitrate reductase [NADH] n=1 Tax=Ostreobium quekettii TaxID=121088 RepID=A0A8S1JBI9_9CHLO|nr:unnamed protein product [Ostreobium quekettii]|eukprot:evm.model.scf_75.15 EVM.evm.TU.scf_75.15   scf_75:123353-127190(+)